MKKLEIYTIALFIIAAIIIAWKIFTGPATVTINGAQFHCTETQPFGIEARCTQYTFRAGAR